MRVIAQISNNLRATVERQEGEIADAARAGVLRASTRLQADLRGAVAGSGLGSGLANSWRMQVYPTGRRSMAPAGLVYSKAPMLIRAFSQGATITSKAGRFLAIPTDEAIAMGYGDTRTSRKGGPVPGGQLRRAAQVRAAVAKLGERNIAVIRISGGRRLMVYTPPAQGRGRGVTRRGGRGRGLSVLRGGQVPLFVLVPVVRLTARLDVDAAEARAMSYLSTELRGAFER